MKSFTLNNIILSALCFLLGSFVRLSSITTLPPGPDERHWVSRSSRIITRFQSNEYISMTTHLGHPGVTPALVMATGQVLSSKLGFEKLFENESLRKLYASRISNALFSSTIFPLMFLAGVTILGVPVSLLATLLLIFDCHHIAISQAAHIDGGLTVLLSAALVALIISEYRRRLSLKLLAGALWGLAVGAKPTAVLFLPCVFAFRVLRRIVEPRDQKLNPTHLPPIFLWSDVWAIIAGHISLSLIWTKVWDPKNNFIRFHRINPHLCTVIRQVGDWLQQHWLVPLGLALLFLIVGHFLRTEMKRNSDSNTRRLKYHLLNGTWLLLFSLLLLSFVPRVLANFVRFWTWVFRLSNVQHRAYGHVYDNIGLGYLELWFRRLPPEVLLGAFVALLLVLFSYRFRNRLADRTESVLFNRERVVVLLTLLLLPISFSLFLSFSSKQTIRYVIPTYPALFLFSSWGLWEGTKCFVSRFSKHGTEGFSIVVLLGIVLFRASVAYAWAPYFAVYANSLSGGAGAASKRGFTVHATGYQNALDHIHRTMILASRDIIVAVSGDVDLIRYAYRMKFGVEKHKVEFQPTYSSYDVDLIMIFAGFEQELMSSVFDERLREIEALNVRGAPIYSIHEVLPSSFQKPLQISLKHTHHETGHMRFDENEQLGRLAVPGVDRRGYLHFGQVLRFRPGRYLIEHRLKIPDSEQLRVSSAERVVRVEFGSKCAEDVTVAKLLGAGTKSIETYCEFTTETRISVRLLWHGTVATRLEAIEIRRAKEQIN